MLFHHAVGNACVHKNVAVSTKAEFFIKGNGVTLGTQLEVGKLKRLRTQCQKSLHQAAANALPAPGVQNGDTL